ncbi:hypothetical protein O181_096166 [Austropuccinia psidii MF-1]|uniref:Integrase zinc-binding domain-containing protein n=1 Tax=Austropuccinia psidii MF-1 TaxID=1389203 RepID=A0A9Q3J6J3_9BASI|nr:hypothetical protein [Austropuccinia psidii MF-1]
MTRWVAFIQLFSFGLVYKPGKTLKIANRLSRRPQSEDGQKEKSDFDEEDEWVKPHPGFAVKHNNILKLTGMKLPSKQEGFCKGMEEYFNTLKGPFVSKEDDFKKIKRNSSNFFSEEGQLKRRNTPNPQVVVSSQNFQRRILKSLHEEMGHRGENETYRRVKKRFEWQGMKKIVQKWVKYWKAFQKRSHFHQKEEARISFTSTLFERVSIGAVHVQAGRWKYLVVARDDLSGWPEAIGSVKLTAKSVSELFTAEWICRYGAPKIGDSIRRA